MLSFNPKNEVNERGPMNENTCETFRYSFCLLGSLFKGQVKKDI